MKPSAHEHAIGALKLVALHLDHPTVIDKATVRAASNEAIGHLQAQNPHAADLGRLYAALIAVTPRGWLPYVTLTMDPITPYGAVITNAAGEITHRQVGKTIDGLTQLIALRFPVGCGEAQPIGGPRDDA